MRIHLQILAFAAVLAATPLLGQPALTGPEFFVAPESPGHQFGVAAASNDSGDQIVVWIASPRLQGRRFGRSGAPLGPAFVVQASPSKSSPESLDVAINPAGRFVVVWYVEDSGKSGSIQARSFDASGHPFGDSFVVSDSMAGARPRVAMDAAGKFVVVWTRLGTGSAGSQILARRYTATGRPLGPPFEVARQNSSLSRFNPYVAVQPGGDFAITWADFDREHDLSHLLVRVFDRTGTPRGPARSISSTVKYASWAASLALAPGGRWMVVWAGGFKEDENYRIFGRLLGPDGRFAGAAFHLGTSNLSYYEHPHPRAVFDGAGSFFAVWMVRESFIPWIRGRHFGPAGELFGPERFVHNRGFEYHEPVVAGSGSGSFTAFWTGYHHAEYLTHRALIVAQRLVAGGEPGILRLDQTVLAVAEGRQEPVELQVQRRDGTAGAVSVEVRLEGAASGSWSIDFADGDSLPQTITIPVPAAVDHDEQIVASLVDPIGGAVLGAPSQTLVEVRDMDVPSSLLDQAGEPVVVARSVYSTSGTGPSVASDAAGGFTVSWFREKNRRVSVAGARYEASGALAKRFQSGSLRSTTGRPLLATLPDGGFIQAWSDFFYPLEESFGQRRDPAGDPLGPVFSFGPVAPLALAPAPGDLWVAVAAGRDNAGPGLFLHRYRGDGIPAGTPVRVSGRILMQPPQADVAADAQGNLVVVWTVPPSWNMPGGVYARLFRSSGKPRGPAFRVATGGFGFDTQPSVAMAASGHFVVAWQRFIFDNRIDIFARSFDASGTPRSGERPVNSNTVGHQIFPAVAVQDDGRFLVAWEDRHVEGWSDAPRGQDFDASGVRLGGEIEIAARGEHVDVSTNGAGLYVVIWRSSDVGLFIAARRFPAPPPPGGLAKPDNIERRSP